MSVYKRASGKWLVLIDVDRDEKGKRIRKSFGTFPTKKDAERVEREALSALDRGIDLTPKTLTVAALFERFISDRRAKDRSIRTVERYESLVKHWILPSIGSQKIAALKPAHILGLVKHADDAGLAPKTQKHILTLMRTALTWAMRLDLVFRNVALAVDAPTVPKSEARSLTEEEMFRFLRDAESGRWGPFFRIALATGARRGELLALRWSDVTPDGSSVLISRAFIETSAKEARIVEKGTKTNRARRIPLGSLGTEGLRAQRAMQAADKLQLGAAFHDSDHIFQAPIGGPLAPYKATDAFRTIRNRLKMKATLHDLRHTAATWMLSSGIDIRSVAQVLGHTQASTTLSVYSHVLPGAEKKAVAAIDARFDAYADSQAVGAIGGPAIREGNRMATVGPLKRKKPRIHAVPVVAPAGFEPALPP
jgi:integrase